MDKPAELPTPSTSYPSSCEGSASGSLDMSVPAMRLRSALSLAVFSNQIIAPRAEALRQRRSRRIHPYPSDQRWGSSAPWGLDKGQAGEDTVDCSIVIEDRVLASNRPL